MALAFTFFCVAIVPTCAMLLMAAFFRVLPFAVISPTVFLILTVVFRIVFDITRFARILSNDV